MHSAVSTRTCSHNWTALTSMQRRHSSQATRHSPHFPPKVFDHINADAEAAGGAWEEPTEYIGSIGRTMFDTPLSEDNSLTVLLPRERLAEAPVNRAHQ